ncbi:hypothetical protein HZ326_24130 [Fusarium oxysporum f. sp. albedinis]|nr:hypothetical protein HZ326_24130 [Fusarium oxysporum f. sp. albedinis]
MDEMALLRAELQDVRQANETLSRRRRAKRTRLKKGGAITVEEGRRAIDQIDGGTQVVAESSRGGGQEGSARVKERRCGICGKTGHNARRCQIVVAVSEGEHSH